jgi:hypothetical protein
MRCISVAFFSHPNISNILQAYDQQPQGQQTPILNLGQMRLLCFQSYLLTASLTFHGDLTPIGFVELMPTTKELLESQLNLDVRLKCDGSHPQVIKTLKYNSWK